jgi:hypothetical protein
MSEEANIPNDPFLTLLTDALRAGPGSAEWREAVAKLQAGGIPDADQYTALVNARQNLESGKSYRSIRAGAGFTRKLENRLAAMDVPDPNTGHSPLSASYISYIGVALVVGVIAVLIVHLTGSATEDLSGTLFNTTLSAKMDGPLGPGWRSIGSLPVDPTNGLAPGPNHSNSDYLGGGLVASNAIASSDVFAIEATFQFQHVSDSLIPQLFVADNSDMNSPTTVSPHELAWLVRDGQGLVHLPNGDFVGTAYKITDRPVTVQIRVGSTQATVQVDGNTVWSGPNLLADKPRYPGVRLLRKGADKKDNVTVRNVRILEK